MQDYFLKIEKEEYSTIMFTVLTLSLSYSLFRSFVLLVHCVSWSALVILAYKFFKKIKHSNTSGPVMPGLKTPIYSIFGALGFLPSRSTMKRTGLPATVYLANLFGGDGALFPKEKIICFNAVFRNWVSLTKAEAVEEFLHSNALVSKPFTELLQPFFGNGLFLSFGPEWKTKRKAVLPTFSYDILKEFVPTFDKQSKNLVDILKRMHQENWIDIVDPVSLCTMDITCETFLGINVSSHKDTYFKFVNAITRCTQTMVQRIVNPILALEIIFRFSAVGRQFKEDIHFIRSFVTQVIQGNKEAKKQEERYRADGKKKKIRAFDIIRDFLTDDQELRDEMISYIFAGSDTTASGLIWALYLIGLYPEIQNKIHAELDAIFGDDHDRSLTVDDLKEMHYLECVLKESQRIYPSVPLILRCALEDFDLCGYKLKKGTIIVINSYTLHRNPEVFPNPEIFDPDRFLPENCVGRSPFAYVPFSAGSRSCIGRRLAIMEEKTVVANVLLVFSLKSLEHRDKVCRSQEVILRSAQPVKLKFTPRKTCGNFDRNTGFQ